MSFTKSLSVAAITAFMSTQASAVDIGQELIYNGEFSRGLRDGGYGPPIGWSSEMYDGYRYASPFGRESYGGRTDTWDPMTYNDPYLKWSYVPNVYQCYDLQQRITAPAGTMVRVSYWVRPLDRERTALSSGFSNLSIWEAEPLYSQDLVAPAEPYTDQTYRFVQTTYDYVLTEDNPYFFLLRTDFQSVHNTVFDLDAVSVVVIPSPGAASLPGVAGLMALRRRR